MANNGSVRIDYDFSAINGPVTINFDGNVKSNTDSDWVSVMIGTVNQPQFILDTSAGILFREKRPAPRFLIKALEATVERESLPGVMCGKATRSFFRTQRAPARPLPAMAACSPIMRTVSCWEAPHSVN